MKRLLNSLKKSISSSGGMAGFTMIELLVVISVIGILAVAVLSSINPIEQINKGRDTRTRSDAAQLINAADRYFAIHESYPWNDDNATNGYTGVGEYEDAFDHEPEDGWDWAQVLVDTAEVKEGFVNRLTNDDSLYVFKTDDSNATMYACFKPTSFAFKQEAYKNCADGTTPSGTGHSLGAGDIPTSEVPCVDSTQIDDDNMICLP
jgi:prepilin-type N-terminal cleavage/methylation domain-containing protein